jgi:hypothetical protein
VSKASGSGEVGLSDFVGIEFAVKRRPGSCQSIERIAIRLERKLGSSSSNRASPISRQCAATEDVPVDGLGAADRIADSPAARHAQNRVQSLVHWLKQKVQASHSFVVSASAPLLRQRPAAEHSTPSQLALFPELPGNTSEFMKRAS